MINKEYFLKVPLIIDYIISVVCLCLFLKIDWKAAALQGPKVLTFVSTRFSLSEQMRLQSAAPRSAARSPLRRRVPALSFTECSTTQAFLTKIMAGRMRKTDVAYKGSNRRVSIVSWSHSESGVCSVCCVGQTFQSQSLAESLYWPVPIPENHDKKYSWENKFTFF